MAIGTAKPGRKSVIAGLIGTVRLNRGLKGLWMLIFTARMSCYATNLAFKEILARTPASLDTFGRVLRSKFHNLLKDERRIIKIKD
jgi:hypothetical protein